MSSCACLTIVRKKVPFDWRVREKTEVVAFLVKLVIEEPFIQVQPESDGAHNVDVQVVASLHGERMDET